VGNEAAKRAVAVPLIDAKTIEEAKALPPLSP